MHAAPEHTTPAPSLISENSSPFSTRVKKKEENWKHQNDNNETQKTDAQWLSDDHKP